MRKERLIVPLSVGVMIAWMTGQAVSSWMFERELSHALVDLQERGELHIERVEAERGWWSSEGRVHVAPLFGDTWQLEVSYRARHGVLSTHLDGEVALRHGPEGARLFDDSLASSSPLWEARYRTLSRKLEGGLQVAPLRITQQGRELAFEGGALRFSGEQGNWRMRVQLASWILSDGAVRLEVGPAILNSQYTYTEGAHAFTQVDRLQIESFAWHQPQLELDARGIHLANRVVLDDEELRLRLHLDLGEIHTAEQILLAGQVDAELSRLDADALRALMTQLRVFTARGEEGMALLTELEPYLLAMLDDSPRLDLARLELDSPMLGLSAQIDGALFFEGREHAQLSLTKLDDPAVQQRWRQRLDGDFVWHELPTVVALWLGLPLDTRTLQVDIGRGQVRVNGRPLPPLWR